MEIPLRNQIQNYLHNKNLIKSDQQGFRINRFCYINLFIFLPHN